MRRAIWNHSARWAAAAASAMTVVWLASGAQPAALAATSAARGAVPATASTVPWNSADLHGATPVVSLSGWNVPKIDILG